MSDDYLWDRTGNADPDELLLEEVMPRIKDRATRGAHAVLGADAHRFGSARPSFISRVRTPTVAVAATLVFVVGAAVGYGLGKPGAVAAIEIREDSVAEEASSTREPPTTTTAAGVAVLSNAPPNPSPSIRAATTARPSSPAATASAEPPAQEAAEPPVRLAPTPTSPPSSPPSSTTVLSSDQIRAAVARHQGEIRRSCWSPAHAAASSASGAVRVSLSVDVNPEGRVVSARSSPDPKGYEGLGSCITSGARTWRFPASSKNTTLSIPLVFAHD